MSLLQSLAIPCAKGDATEFELMRHLEQHLPPTEVVGGKWFNYDKETGCWEVGTKDDYRRLALAVINPARRRVTTAHRVLDHLEDSIRKKLDFCGAIRARGLDTVLINTLNKVLIVTPTQIEVKPHDMEYRFTRALQVKYEPGAKHDLYDQVRAQILPNALDQHLLQLLFANVFIPDGRYEVAGVLYGEAGSGKDTLITPLVALFGNTDLGLVTNYSISQICDPRTYTLPRLQFASVNICSELNSKEVEDSSIFKLLVSGQPLPVRDIYDKPFNMITPCKVIFLTNGMPEFRGGTDAERRRMRFIRCEFKPDKVDVLLKEKLRPAHPGALNWLLAGLQELLAMGAASMPLGGPASQEVHERFFASNDPINAFVTTCCILDRTKECPKDDVRRAFATFAEDNDISDKFVKVFFSRLYKRFTSLKPKRSGTDGARVQVITGLCLSETGLQFAKSPPPAVVQ